MKAHRAELNRLQSMIAGHHKVSDDMVCPISCEMMKDPVVSVDGHTYERVCIEQWFATGARTSPVTNESLSSTTLVPNIALRKVIATVLSDCREFRGDHPLGDS